MDDKLTAKTAQFTSLENLYVYGNMYNYVSEQAINIKKPIYDYTASLLYYIGKFIIMHGYHHHHQACYHPPADIATYYIAQPYCP